jgi:hypothetical protein
MRFEHGREGTELACMEVMIDLHAADIEERHTAFARLVETAQCLIATSRSMPSATSSSGS